MKRVDLKTMSVAGLVDRFIALGLKQDKAIGGNEIGKYNSLYMQMMSVTLELKSRENDQRRALLPLYFHTNMEVRLRAVKATMAIAPVAARQQLEDIYASGWQPQAGSAGMSLENLDSGIWKPD
jgi:hypothetical protein